MPTWFGNYHAEVAGLYCPLVQYRGGEERNGRWQVNNDWLSVADDQWVVAGGE